MRQSSCDRRLYEAPPNMRRREGAMKAQEIRSSRLDWGPFLMLLMLCRRKPRDRRPVQGELTLPRGCAFAVRYSSR